MSTPVLKYYWTSTSNATAVTAGTGSAAVGDLLILCATGTKTAISSNVVNRDGIADSDWVLDATVDAVLSTNPQRVRVWSKVATSADFTQFGSLTFLKTFGPAGWVSSTNSRIEFLVLSPPDASFFWSSTRLNEALTQNQNITSGDIGYWVQDPNTPAVVVFAANMGSSPSSFTISYDGATANTALLKNINACQVDVKLYEAAQHPVSVTVNSAYNNNNHAFAMLLYSLDSKNPQDIVGISDDVRSVVDTPIVQQVYVVPESFNPASIVPGLINPDTGQVWVDTPITKIPSTLINPSDYDPQSFLWPSLQLPDPNDRQTVPDVSSILSLWMMLVPQNGVDEDHPNIIRFPENTFYRTEYGLQFGAPLSYDLSQRIPAVGGRHPEIIKSTIDWKPKNLIVDFNGGGLCFSDKTDYALGTSTNRVFNGTIVDEFHIALDSYAAKSQKIFGSSVNATLSGPGVPSGTIVTGVGGQIIKLTQPAQQRQTSETYTFLDPTDTIKIVDGGSITTSDRTLGEGYTQHANEILLVNGDSFIASRIAGRPVQGLGFGTTSIESLIPQAAKTQNNFSSTQYNVKFTLANGHVFTGNTTRNSNFISGIQIGTQVQQINKSAGASPLSGTFTLTLGDLSTGPIPYNATAAAVQSAFVKLPDVIIGDVNCTGGPLPGAPINVAFKQNLALTSQPLMTVNHDAIQGGTYEVLETSSWSPGLDISDIGSAMGSDSITSIGIPTSDVAQGSAVSQKFNLTQGSLIGDCVVGESVVYISSLISGSVATGSKIYAAGLAESNNVVLLTTIVSISGDSLTVSRPSYETLTNQKFISGTGNTFVGSTVAGSDIISLSSSNLTQNDVGHPINAIGFITDPYVYPVQSQVVSRPLTVRVNNAMAVSATPTSFQYEIASQPSVEPRRKNGVNLISVARAENVLFQNGVMVGPLSGVGPSGQICGAASIKYDASRESWWGAALFGAKNCTFDAIDVYGMPGDFIYFSQSSEPGPTLSATSTPTFTSNNGIWSLTIYTASSHQLKVGDGITCGQTDPTTGQAATGLSGLIESVPSSTSFVISVAVDPSDWILNRSNNSLVIHHNSGVLWRNSYFSGCGRQGWTINDAVNLEMHDNNITRVARFLIDSEPSSTAYFAHINIHDNTSTGGGLGFMNAAHPHMMGIGDFTCQNWVLLSGHFKMSIKSLGSFAYGPKGMVLTNSKPSGFYFLNNYSQNSTSRLYSNSKVPMVLVSNWDTVVFQGNTDYGDYRFAPLALSLANSSNVVDVPNSFIGFRDSSISVSVGVPRTLRSQYLNLQPSGSLPSVGVSDSLSTYRAPLNGLGWSIGLLKNYPTAISNNRYVVKSETFPDGYEEVFGDGYARISLTYPPNTWQGAAGTPPTKSGPNKTRSRYEFSTVTDPLVWKNIVAVGLFFNGNLEMWGELVDENGDPTSRSFNVGETPMFTYPDFQVNISSSNTLRILQ